jgi:hypothetical protein
MPPVRWLVGGVVLGLLLGQVESPAWIKWSVAIAYGAAFATLDLRRALSEDATSKNPTEVWIEQAKYREGGGVGRDD